MRSQPFQFAFIVFAALQSCACAEQRPVPLTVMTFNIRYGTANDGPNAWKHRKPLVMDVIRRHDPDIMGLQEVLAFQRDEIKTSFPAYECVGVGRDDGKDKGEFAPILYKRDRFEPADQGWFWLSPTPTKPGSKGWDAACPRIATWVWLRTRGEKPSELLVLNTHFDHQSKTAREQSAYMLGRFLNNLPYAVPVIVCGDFNCGPDERPHFVMERQMTELFDARIQRPLPLQDVYALGHSEVDAGTFHAFEGVETGKRIDWIFKSPEFAAVSCEIDRTSANERYPSDHFPVIARLTLQERKPAKVVQRPINSSREYDAFLNGQSGLGAEPPIATSQPTSRPGP